MPGVGQIGSYFIGILLNWLFLGFLTVQVYMYSLSGKRDRIAIKSLVYSVYGTDIIQTVITTHATWTILVDQWGDEDILIHQPWSVAALPVMCGVVSCMVQIFFAWRIWILQQSRIMRVMVVSLVVIALLQTICSIVGSIEYGLGLTGQTLVSLVSVFTVWLVGSFACDILITLSLLVILRKARAQTTFKETETVVTKLIVLTVQTGFITAAAAGVQLTLFLLNPTNFSDIPAFILGKMYSNVLLATLNARTIIAREATHEVHSSSGFDESNGTRNGTASGLVFGVPTQPTQAEIGMRILDIHHDNPHEEEAPTSKVYSVDFEAM
ncbi:hypothetical protein PLICRDRAFT_174938 [Plicaturopsis crispa FD-325 SS-3]|nr:hypothetical protein PLICRDRAFT_174938 [Plicaturopsis crispa FD-325 SS-3]